MQPGGGWFELIETECEDGLPVVAGLTAPRLIVQLPPAGALPALMVTDAGEGEALPVANEMLFALRVQPPVTLKEALTAPDVPPVRVAEKAVEPVEAGMLEAVLPTDRLIWPAVLTSTTPMATEVGFPGVAGLTGVSVTWQLDPAAALPALTVTEAGDGAVLLSANDTLEALRVQLPDVTVRLALAAPERPPVRVTDTVVEPVATGMLPAVAPVLSERTVAGAVTAVMPTEKVLGVPTGALEISRSVTSQFPPTVAAPGVRVTVAGIGTAEPLVKSTVRLLREQPPVTPSLPKTSPLTPPVRVMAKLVEPLTGMAAEVPERLMARVPIASRAVPVHENVRLPSLSPKTLA